VSQPYERDCCVPQPGKIDKSLGEFWSESAWTIPIGGHNLSAYERDKLWLNIKGKQFLELSYLMGTDNEGDGRGIVAGDFRNTGQQDLVLRQSGGGPVVMYENQMPPRHFLTVTLRGTRSNRLGIGARLVAHAGGQKLVRELFPANGFRAQMASQVHLGLADAEQIDRLVIQWPSGQTQELTNLAVNRHVVITEGRQGADAVEEVIPGKVIQP
jgi:hypothetical protein